MVRAATLCALLCSLSSAPAQSTSEAISLSDLVKDVTRYQLADMEHASWSVRYKVHRTDDREDSVRDLVESSDGNVARTLARQGRPLTPEQDQAEQERLRSITPGEAAKHHRGGQVMDRYGTDLVSAMPRAMDYRLAAGQPQLSGISGPQIVLDYAPRPDFKPSSTAQSLLTGLAGRMWIDASTHHLLRIEVHVTRNLNLALGLLARVYQGGTLNYEQRPVGDGHDAYTHIDIHVVLRELMVKTVPYQSVLDASDVILLPAVPTLSQAVELLLSDTDAKHPPAPVAAH